MIDIILVTDKEIAQLKRRWFGENRTTDVIAFDDGEIYISVDTAKRQARERRISLKMELLRLIVHGLAHIAGYDDTSPKDFCEMREMEWKVLISSMACPADRREARVR